MGQGIPMVNEVKLTVQVEGMEKADSLGYMKNPEISDETYIKFIVRDLEVRLRKLLTEGEKAYWDGKISKD